jgi:hypothetical protein
MAMIPGLGHLLTPIHWIQRRMCRAWLLRAPDRSRLVLRNVQIIMNKSFGQIAGGIIGLLSYAFAGLAGPSNSSAVGSDSGPIGFANVGLTVTGGAGRRNGHGDQWRAIE